MKVTAIISDEILEEVRKYTQGDNLTECLRIALEDWVATKKLRELSDLVAREPLQFIENVEKIRELNRKVF